MTDNRLMTRAPRSHVERKLGQARFQQPHSRGAFTCSCVLCIVQDTIRKKVNVLGSYFHTRDALVSLIVVSGVGEKKVLSSIASLVSFR
jgi:hypothetical protein